MSVTQCGNLKSTQQKYDNMKIHGQIKLRSLVILPTVNNLHFLMITFMLF